MYDELAYFEIEERYGKTAAGKWGAPDMSNANSNLHMFFSHLEPFLNLYILSFGLLQGVHRPHCQQLGAKFAGFTRQLLRPEGGAKPSVPRR